LPSLYAIRYSHFADTLLRLLAATPIFVTRHVFIDAVAAADIFFFRVQIAPLMARADIIATLRYAYARCYLPCRQRAYGAAESRLLCAALSACAPARGAIYARAPAAQARHKARLLRFYVAMRLLILLFMLRSALRLHVFSIYVTSAS